MLEKLPDAIGHALRHQRAGLEHCSFSRIDLRNGTGAISVSSLAFADHAPIPQKYTADGPGLSPPLAWSGVPPQAASVVLLVEDADAPTPNPLVHAIVVGLRPDETALREGALSSPDHEGSAALETGRNSYLQTAWLPPDPPPGHGVHRYLFQVFALGPGAHFSESPGREAVHDALREHALASGCLIGTYERPDTSISERASATAIAAAPAAQG
jgi:Raf kinase inhibitor-like YbhB/YbcL family protein